MHSIMRDRGERPFETDLFSKMKEVALQLLSESQNGPYTQAIVLQSVTGDLYGTRIGNACLEEKAEETALALRTKEREIRHVLCMWQDGSVDLPSFAFREMLCASQPKNADALVFVTAAGGVGTKLLSQTMK